MTTSPIVEMPSVLDGRYEIGPQVGQGGMAKVYRAHDRTTGATVAIKVLRDDIVPVSGRARFAREIEFTAQMRHPGILQILATGEVNGRPFYVMPFIKGPSLHDRLVGGRLLPIHEAITIAAKVADALAYAHSQGVIHRDIKPANILLDGDQPIVADFGIARAIDAATAERLTESGLALGTAHYMSPEQGSTDQIDGRSDIYSLGCVLYEMLTGTPPFPGSSVQQVLARHAASAVPSVRDVRSAVSPTIEGVLMRALEKTPADRFATAEEFAAALRMALTAPVDAVPNSGWRNRRLAIAIAAIAVIGVATFLAMQSRTAPLDSNRILVLPLVGTGSTGEDAATIVGAALDGVGDLRWVDGWPLLSADQRRDAATLPAHAARDVARAAGARFALTGRIVPRGDSLDVALDLRDVAGDSVVARGTASARQGEPWRAALRAVNSVLPRLITSKAPSIAADWQNRSPKAVAAYLQGEAAYRRLQMPTALARFREALGYDSLFAAAALRGAQAASWQHDPRQAGDLAQLALRRPLSPRDAHFARGLDAFVQGNADSSVHELQRAIAMDSTMAIAWTQLGETFTHLLPRRGDVDSMAIVAFEQSRRLDSAATTSAYHLAERAARAGDVARTTAFLKTMRAAVADTEVLRQIELMQRCADAHGKGNIDWSSDVRTHPLQLLVAATKLAAGGAQLECAGGAFATILSLDTAAKADADARRFAALVGLVGLFHAQGHPKNATAEIDGYVARWGSGNTLLMRQALLDSSVAPRARAVAREDSARQGADFRHSPYSNRLWLLGVWSARDGRVATAEAVARELNRRADSTHNNHNNMDRWHAQSVSAYAALASHDTTRALTLLAPLLGASLSSDDIEWQEAASMADERLMYAQLLLARRDARGALDVANVFDSLEPNVFLLYLAPSLEVRRRAAEALGDTRLAARFASRLSALRGRSVP